MSSATSTSCYPKRTRHSTDTTTTTNTGPYNKNFQQNLIDGGVYPAGYEFPDGRFPPRPADWDETNQRLTQRRPSLSPSRFSDDDFRNFIRADIKARKEKQVTTSVIPIIEGVAREVRCVSEGIPFTNLEPLTNFTLASGNPDIYDGARPEQLNRLVRDELSRQIIPTTQGDLPLAPNFFLEVKGPEGTPVVAQRQACYYGALGARGIHSLQSYGQEKSSYDNNAHTITCTYDNGLLIMYTIHPTQATGSAIRPEYSMHVLKGWYVRSDRETFRAAATYYRNGRDWAKEQRDEAIKQANRRAAECHA
jgi:hypothetical protein